jgi:PAS domain-containing protein
MPATRDSLLDLVGLAYEAAAEPSLWPQVAADAGRAFEAPHVMLGVADCRGNEAMRAATQRVSQANFAGYLTPEINPGVAFSASTPPTTVELGSARVSDSDLERSLFYQTLMRPLDLWHVAIMNVHRDDAYLAPMAIMRVRSQRPFGERELRALCGLAPHLNRALRVTLRLREIEARAAALAETSDRALAAIVLTDAFGRIAEANSLARAILDDRDGLTIVDGVLRASRSDDNAKLVRLLLEAAGARAMPMSGVMQVARPSCRRAFALVVSPTRAGRRPSAARTPSRSLSPTPSAIRRSTPNCLRASTASPRVRRASRRCSCKAVRRPRRRTSSR